jgi:hypothetical protein
VDILLICCEIRRRGRAGIRIATCQIHTEDREWEGAGSTGICRETLENLGIA